MIIPRQKPHSPCGAFSTFVSLLMKGALVRGEAGTMFEHACAGYLGVRHAIAVSSARMGLYLLLRELGTGKGDEVLVPSLTCPAVPSVVVAAGAVPVFIDSDPRTFTMSPAEMEKNITPRTRAVIATHLEGAACDIDAIVTIAAKRGIAVIEDCAQAFGSSYRGKKLGGFGRAAYFSFASGKQINTMGGGIVVTNDDGLARALRREVEGFGYPELSRLLRKALFQFFLDIGLTRAFFTAFVFPCIVLSNLFGRDIVTMLFEDDGAISSMNAFRTRLSNLQAAWGLRKLESIQRDNDARMSNAAFFNGHLNEAIQRQDAPEGAESAYCYFSIAVDDRAGVKRRLILRGIDTQASWNRSCSALRLFRPFARACPVADRLERTLLYLPVYPGLRGKELRRIVSGVNAL